MDVLEEPVQLEVAEDRLQLGDVVREDDVAPAGRRERSDGRPRAVEGVPAAPDVGPPDLFGELLRVGGWGAVCLQGSGEEEIEFPPPLDGFERRVSGS